MLLYVVVMVKGSLSGLYTHTHGFEDNVFVLLIVCLNDLPVFIHTTKLALKIFNSHQKKYYLCVHKKIQT